MSESEQIPPEDEIDRGTGEGPAYGGPDADAPLFFLHGEVDPGLTKGPRHERSGYREDARNVFFSIRKVVGIFCSNAAAWSAFASVVMAVATVAYTVYAHRQWRAISGQLSEMHDATAEAKRAANIAADTLKEIRDGQGAKDTHTLAEQAKTQAIQTKNLADAAKSQAQIALGTQKEIKNTDRAFVFVRGVTTAIFRSVNGAPGFQTLIDWQNSGATPTKNLFIQTNQGAGNQLGTSFDFKFPLGTKPDHAFLGPKSGELIWVGDAMSDYVLKSIYADGGGWFVYGRATYDDVFAERHLVEFCWQARTSNVSPETMTYLPCAGKISKYNCSDEECEDYEEQIAKR